MGVFSRKGTEVCCTLLPSPRKRAVLELTVSRNVRCHTYTEIDVFWLVCPISVDHRRMKLSRSMFRTRARKLFATDTFTGHSIVHKLNVGVLYSLDHDTECLFSFFYFIIINCVKINVTIRSILRAYPHTSKHILYSSNSSHKSNIVTQNTNLLRPLLAKWTKSSLK